MVFQCTGDDFRGRGRTGIDQDHHRQAAGDIARLGIDMRSAIDVAATRRDNLALFKEGVGHRHGLGQKTARIVAKIEDNALQIIALFAEEIIDRIHQPGRCLFREGGDPDISDAVEDFRPDRPDLDEIANNGDIERLLLAALYLDCHFRANLAAQPFHRLGQLHADDGFIINGNQVILGLQASVRGWRVIDRRDDLDHALFHCDLDTKAAKASFCLLLHFREVLGIEEGRMRVERGQHAGDRRLDKFAVLDLVDIALADTLEDVTEQPELTIGILAR